MTNFKIRSLSSDDHFLWSALLEESDFPSVIRDPKFLSYHGDNITDESVCVFKDGELIAIFPAARSFTNDFVLESHPGSTFGGLVVRQNLSITELERIYELIIDYSRSKGFQQIRIRLVPRLFRHPKSENEKFVLIQLGFKVYKSGLSCVLPLTKGEFVFSNRRKRGIKKSNQIYSFFPDNNKLSDFWEILSKNLLLRHSTSPTHTIADITWLKESLPQAFQLWVAVNRTTGDLDAGVLLIRSMGYCHAQYIASSQNGRSNSALDGLFSALFTSVKEEGIDSVSLGISTEGEHDKLNEGLFEYKSEFGAESLIVERLYLDL